ncbi:hypothetical protein LPJ81_006246, partial [Coemansia sp. IMI 209127]
ITAILFNASYEDIKIEAGERIAQLIVKHIEKPVVVEVSQLAASARGTHGFGSTNKQQPNINALTSWSVDGGKLEDSYSGDKKLEAIHNILAGATPSTTSADSTLKKFRINEG